MVRDIEFPVLFAKVGWMRYYDGPRRDDPKPIGGGLHNRNHFGHEGFNFRRHGDRLYGFVAAPAKDGKLALQRIDPSAVGKRIKSATVIFAGTDPEFGGKKIIGWYRNATIHAKRVPYEKAIGEQLQSEVAPKFPMGYQFEGLVSDGATLVPEAWRRRQKFEIPQRNGIGQACVCYRFDERGNENPERLKWMRNAVDYVDSYSGPNLLENDGIQYEVEDAVVAAAEGAGLQSDPRIRREIEKHAMECARNYLVRRGYKEITRTDDGHCYDYTCKSQGKTVYVEVKGTRTLGEKVVITKNEKAHAESHPETILYMRHSIDVKLGKRIRVYGGKEKVLDRWHPQSGSFCPIAYLYTLPTG